MKWLILIFLIAGISVAELPESCQYVFSNYFLFDVDKVKNCFDTYQVHQDVVDAIIRNLEIIHDTYPYTDIAMNPPSQPAGYFKKMNFTAELENLKTELASSDRIVSKVIRPTQKLINGFRDGHFYITISETDNKYDNMFSDVYSILPFNWEAGVNEDKRYVLINDPKWGFLPSETCYTIEKMYDEVHYAKTVDGQDAFEFFSKFLGEYNEMKSPQGALLHAKQLLTSGFRILSYPLDNLFDNHTIVFSDDDETQITFNLGFFNARMSSQTREAERIKITRERRIADASAEEEQEIIGMIKDFKMRPKRQVHSILPCDNAYGMNYIQIDSFNYAGFQAWQFMQELAECVSFFDMNSDPITIILPDNGGGAAPLRAITQFLLMPNTDFRTIRSFRKSENSKRMAPSIISNRNLVGNPEACAKMDIDHEFEKFWEKTIIDDFGGGVTHSRTEKIHENYMEQLEYLRPYAMRNHIRKPTDIIVASDGMCFSACSFFVDNVIRTGAAIVAGFGLTNPGDDLFAAAQCPSGVDSPALFFDELSDNSQYGLDFHCTTTESYDISAKKDEIIPGDYSIYPVDVHLSFYEAFLRDYNKRSLEDVTTLVLLSRTQAYTVFQTKCNPKNKRLLFVSENCTSTKPHSVRSGYSCGSDGYWNKNTCKIASCEEGYVVDFENDQCVPNTCDPRYTPPSPSPSPSPSPLPPIASSSAVFRPMMSFIAGFILFIVHLMF